MTDAYKAHRAQVMAMYPYSVSRVCIDGKYRYYDRTDDPDEYVRYYRSFFDPEGTTKLRIKDSRTKKVVYQD